MNSILLYKQTSLYKTIRSFTTIRVHVNPDSGVDFGLNFDFTIVYHVATFNGKNNYSHDYFLVRQLSVLMSRQHELYCC